MSLNLNDFRVVFDDDFAKDKALDTQLWSNSWGNADQYSVGGGALTLTGRQADSWYPVGFMQTASAKSAGEGYGLYQFTGYGNPGQGSGVAVLMWRADNQFLDASAPGKATEIDLFESLDGSQTVLSTVHYYDAGSKDDNGSEYNTIPVDPSKQHTYAVDWERGSITYYVDGQEYYKDTVHAPLDAADGGSNEVMGAEVIDGAYLVTTPTVQLHIVDMSYSAPVPPGTSPPVASVVTLGGGIQSYNAASGATVQAGSGQDTVKAVDGHVTVTGSSGSLSFINGSGASSVQGAAGSLTVFGGGGGNYSGGTAGRNVLVSQGASGGNTTLTGAAAGDQLFGSANGNDVLNLAKGREVALVGGGNTTVNGGNASSVIFTSAGSTTVNGGAAGGDTIVGGGGSLSVNGKDGENIFGGSGALNVSGSTGGADVVIGGSGALGVTGHGSNILVVAGSTTSSINIGNGASLVYSGQALTTVTGGTGSMQLVLESGKATVNEGAGACVYDVVKGAAGGVDVLNGFKPGSDVIQLYGYHAADVQVSTGAVSTLLSLADGTRIQLVGITDPGTSIHL